MILLITMTELVPCQAGRVSSLEGAAGEIAHLILNVVMNFEVIL